jgi:hypothetical protein
MRWQLSRVGQDCVRCGCWDRRFTRGVCRVIVLHAMLQAAFVVPKVHFLSRLQQFGNAPSTVVCQKTHTCLTWRNDTAYPSYKSDLYQSPGAAAVVRLYTAQLAETQAPNKEHPQRPVVQQTQHWFGDQGMT